MIVEGRAIQKVGRVSSRDAKGFFEDPEPRSSLADFHLPNPRVFILMIFPFFMGSLSTSGNPGVCRGKYLSLFPAPVQGKVFNFKVFREEFWGWKLDNGKK